MTTNSLTERERGAEQARRQLAQHGARRCHQLVERAVLAGLLDQGIVTRHREFWRGFRNEVAAQTAIASRRTWH